MSSFLSRGVLVLLTTGVALFACADLVGVTASDTTTSSNKLGDDAGPGEPSDSVNNGDIAITPAANVMLSFGDVDCGTTSRTQQTIVIHNLANRDTTYDVIPPAAPFKVVDSNNGAPLKPYQNAQLVVTVSPDAAGDATGAVVITSERTLATIPLSAKGMGAALDWTTASPDFGKTKNDVDTPMTITLSNKNGTSDAIVDGFTISTGDFTIDPPSKTIPAGSDADFTLTLKKGAVNSTASATVVPIVKKACGAPPTLTAKGNRIDTKITVSSADFGKKACNSTPTDARTITISNYNPAMGLRWSIPTPTKFQITKNPTGTLDPANGQTPTTGTVEFKLVTLPGQTGPIEEDLKATIQPTTPAGADSGDPQLLDFALKVDVHGAVLVVNPTALSFVAASGKSQQKSFTVQNTGNDGIWLDWSFNKRSGDPPAWAPPGGSPLPAGFTISEQVVYEPSQDPSDNLATLTARAQGSTICNTPTPVVNIDGHTP